MSLYDDVHAEALHDWLDERDPGGEVRERAREDDEALEYWHQHADDTPPPEQDVRA